ncbi:uncharacterized protein V1516DRAFT_120376 [Lipomyces oligophaga]|uniref:uncharacterized protein n=1 Tax=Lipomyces oligophaga TaxID=45792 RepID=UPI0034D00C12
MIRLPSALLQRRFLSVALVLLLVTFAALITSAYHFSDSLPSIRVSLSPGGSSGSQNPTYLSSGPIKDPTHPVYDLSSSAGVRDFIVHQYEENHVLKKAEHPIDHLAFCSKGLSGTHSPISTVVKSVTTKDGSVVPIEFPWWGPKTPRKVNPSLLPYPKSHSSKYFVLARADKRPSAFNKRDGDKNNNGESKERMTELVYCDMDWSADADSPWLECKNNQKTARIPLTKPTPGLCPDTHKLLEVPTGAQDAKLFFSPIGEPLVLFGMHGQGFCWGQYIMDMRAIVPELNETMHIQHVPMRFEEPTLVPRDRDDPVEKNYFLLWDEDNTPFVSRRLLERSLSNLQSFFDGEYNAPLASANFAIDHDPKCVKSLLRDYAPDSNRRNFLHQASNSLRVTLCNFPCIPTIHNTVLIEIFHVKLLRYLSISYKRYVLIMNATAPFEILGRTSSIVYVGTEQRNLLYTTTIQWDPHHTRRRDWNEKIYGGHAIWQILDHSDTNRVATAESANKIGLLDSGMDLKNVELTPDDDIGGDDPATWESPQQEPEMPTENQLWRRTVNRGKRSLTHKHPRRKFGELPFEGDENDVKDEEDVVNKYLKEFGLPDDLYQNQLVSQYYHGWLDDTIVITIGVKDSTSVALHVVARDILECYVSCHNYTASEELARPEEIPVDLPMPTNIYDGGLDSVMDDGIEELDIGAV